MFKVQLLQPSIDFETKRVIIQAEVIEGNYREFYEDNSVPFTEYAMEIKRWRNKRSLNANALFHKMVDEIARALTPPISSARCKNILMARYGVTEYLDDEKTIPATIKTNIPPEILLEQADEHWKVARSDAEDIWFYTRMKPTHEYDTKEFSVLLDGTIEDAKELGIEVCSEEEKRKALECWGVEI